VKELQKFKKALKSDYNQRQKKLRIGAVYKDFQIYSIDDLIPFFQITPLDRLDEF